MAAAKGYPVFKHLYMVITSYKRLKTNISLIIRKLPKQIKNYCLLNFLIKKNILYV